MTVMKKKTFTIDFFLVEVFFDLNYFHYSNEFCNKHHFVDNNLFITFEMTNKQRFIATFLARGLSLKMNKLQHINIQRWFYEHQQKKDWQND